MSPAKKTTTTALEASNLNWKPIEKLPPDDPSVILIFQGLMGVAYNKDLDYCEIGMHSKAPKHELSIEVYDDLPPIKNPAVADEIIKKYKPRYTYKFGPASSAPIDIIRLDIREAIIPDTAPKVRFYMPSTPDDMDFNLMTDLEGPKFYNRPLKKKPGSFKPIVHIKHGIFVTLTRTTFDYKRVAPNDPLLLGPIAEAIGTLIYLKVDADPDKNGYVALRIGPEELRVPAVKDKTSIIYFDNSCPKEECQFDYASTKKEKRNDFYLYYETFEIPSDKEEYELIETTVPRPKKEELTDGDESARGSKKDETPSVKVTDSFREKVKLFVDFFSNPDSPCGAAGFGQSNGTGGGS